MDGDPNSRKGQGASDGAKKAGVMGALAGCCAALTCCCCCLASAKDGSRHSNSDGGATTLQSPTTDATPDYDPSDEAEVADVDAEA